MKQNNFYGLEQIDIQGISSYLSQIDPVTFSSIGCLLGIYLSLILNLNQQNTIGNFLELVGQALLTTNAQGQTLYNQRANKQIKEILYRIRKLEQDKTYSDS